MVAVLEEADCEWRARDIHEGVEQLLGEPVCGSSVRTYLRHGCRCRTPFFECLVAAAADNAARESFYALLRKNVVDGHPRQTREELRLAIITWIEPTYNRRRRQRGLGRPTPVECELSLHNRALEAA